MTTCPFCQTRIHITLNNLVIPIHDREIISKLSSEMEYMEQTVKQLERELAVYKRVAKTQRITLESTRREALEMGKRNES